MHRRTFLGTLGVLAARHPVEAQSPAKVARIGFLSAVSAQAEAAYETAFRSALRDLGYVEGQTAVIEARYAGGRADRLLGLAAELVQLKLDVIVVSLTPAVRPAQQATRTVPIVMALSGDPVGERLVGQLARPGGNITGLSSAVPEIATKRVELLKTVAPDIARIAHLARATFAQRALSETEAAGRTLGLQVKTLLVRDPGELDQIFSSLKSARIGGLVVSLALQGQWRRIVDLSLLNRLPTVSGPREFVELGGLMAYGPTYADLFRRAATYVDKILKGAKPADLPIEQPTKFELVINLKTAKALGLAIPPSLLARADQVIDP